MRSLWWLTYARGGKPSGVVIIEGRSIVNARTRAALEAVEAGAEFAEGHELERAAMVPAKAVGRMLTLTEAKELLDRV